MPQFVEQFKVTERPGVEQQVVGALGSIGAATLASRVLGFVRDMVVALVFGAGPVTDAFFVAFRIPNILRRLLAEGALSTAVIPVFTDYASTRSREEFRRLLRAILGAALVVLGATAVLGILAAPWIVRCSSRASCFRTSSSSGCRRWPWAPSTPSTVSLRRRSARRCSTSA